MYLHLPRTTETMEWIFYFKKKEERMTLLVEKYVGCSTTINKSGKHLSLCG